MDIEICPTVLEISPSHIKKNFWLDKFYVGHFQILSFSLVIIDPFVKKKYQGLVADIIIQLLKVHFGHICV